MTSHPLPSIVRRAGADRLGHRSGPSAGDASGEQHAQLRLDRGLRVIRLTDGEGNEENAPDALYEWLP